jgi:hypothetical protein
MIAELPEQLYELAQFQRGILSSHQVRSCGLGKDVIRLRVQNGRWQRLHSGVYAVFSGEPGRPSCGPPSFAGQDALLSYHTAAELFGRNPCLVASQVAQALRCRGSKGGRPCSPGCPVTGTT